MSFLGGVAKKLQREAEKMKQRVNMFENYQFTATVFLPTKYISEESRQFKGWHCMTWHEVREMHSAGIAFGSHSVSHQQLNTLTVSEVEQEIRGSKETIEDKLGGPVDSFSYPFAFPETDRPFKRRLRDLLVAQGYKSGVTTVIGTFRAKSDCFFLPRFRPDGTKNHLGPMMPGAHA